MAQTQPSAGIQHLSTVPLDVLERQMASGAIADELRAALGEETAAELEGMAQANTAAVLGAGERPLVIVLPGITGSTLMNISGDVGLIWLNPLALVAGKLPLLRLDQSGQRDMPGVQIVPAGLIPTHYLLIQMHLKTFGGCDVLSFPFDWRRSPAAAVERLRQLVTDQFDQTGRKVHLVGHSMGGLVARDLCLRYPEDAERAVAQVIQLGTPNYGSYSAVQSMLAASGVTLLAAKLNSANAPTDVTRSCPGIYAMFPVEQAGYPSGAPMPYPYGGDLDLYNADAYRVDGISAAHLGAARQGYTTLAEAGQAPVPVHIIAGYDIPTCIGVRAGGDGASFDFTALTADGDGTVPLASVTALPGANLLYGRGLKHADLPLYGVVRRAVADLVHGRPAAGLEELPNAGVLGAEPPAATLSGPETPGPNDLTEAELDAIAERIRTGQETPADLRALAQLQ